MISHLVLVYSNVVLVAGCLDGMTAFGYESVAVAVSCLDIVHSDYYDTHHHVDDIVADHLLLMNGLMNDMSYEEELMANDAAAG